VYWHTFEPEEFDYEFNEDELTAHGVTVDEAVEVLWNNFDVFGTRGIASAISWLAD
jgi:hypothetical protein